jgi:hypothetical protein
MEKVVKVLCNFNTVITVLARNYSKRLLARSICANRTSMEALYLIPLLLLFICCYELTTGKSSDDFNRQLKMGL